MKSLLEKKRSLVEIYQRAIYEVRLPQIGSHRLRVSSYHPELDAYLRSQYPSCGPWAFLTAWNPRSVSLPRMENERRQKLLYMELETMGVEFLPGEGRAPPGQIPWSEASVFALNLDLPEARALGKQFEQNAILVGEVGGPARISFVEDCE